MVTVDQEGSIAVVIKNVGHVPMEEAPKATADFISDAVSPTTIENSGDGAFNFLAAYSNISG